MGMDSYSLHRDESINPDSHIFKPERWLDNHADMDRYLESFSNGARQCIAIK